MNPYGSAREPYSRDGPSRSLGQRARSRSPPRPYADANRSSIRIPRRDPDAPPELLPRKPPGSSTNAVPVNATGSYAHSYSSASTSASIPASSLDRSAAASRSQPSDRTDPSSTRRGSAPVAAIEDSAGLVEQMYALPPERHLFEQIEHRRFSINELRRDLNDQLKKLRSIQDLVNKAGNQHMARLTQQQTTVADLERQIRSHTDELYRMQLRWHVGLFPSLFAAASAPFQVKLQQISQEAKIERDNDRKHHDEFQQQTYSYLGQIKVFQSDISRFKSDLSALTKDNDRLRNDVTNKHKDLRKDLDADVSHIKDSRERIKRLERDLAAMRDNPAKPYAGPASVVSNSVRAVSTAPSSPGDAAAHAAVQEPRARPAPQFNAAPATASPSRATQNAPPASSSAARGSEPVTQAQFRKWVRDHQQDLEVRFDEVKDLAVQEATAETQACIDDRIRALARKWRNRALQGQDIAAVANAVNPSPDPAANADGTTPTGAEHAQRSNEVYPIAVTANATQTTSTTFGQANQDKTLAQTQWQPDSAIPTEAVAPIVTSQAAATASSAPEAPKSNANTVSATQPPVSAPTAPSVNGAAQSSDVKQNGSGTQLTVLSVEALRRISTMLKDHDTQLGTVKQEIDALRTFQDVSFDKLIQSPVRIKQLLEALDQNGDASATALRETVAQLRPSIDGMRADVDAMRTSQLQVKQQIRTLEEWKQQFIVAVNERLDLLQRQFEMLDDQSSLQGALLVKLSEHANPRRSSQAGAGGAAQASPVVQTPAVRSPLAQHAQHARRPPSDVTRQPPQHMPTLASAMRPQTFTEPTATALSAHMQASGYPAHMQSYQQVPQPQQPQQPPPPPQPYAVPRPTYQY